MPAFGSEHMDRNINRRLRLLHRLHGPWNVFSAILYPLVTLLASILIIIVAVSRSMHLITLVPLLVLSIGSMGAFVFWCFRLLMKSLNRKALLLWVGTIVCAVGVTAFAFLVLITFIYLLSPEKLRTTLFTGSKYWLFFIWASVESSQHYLYKLSFGKRDTLGYLLRQGSMDSWRLPLGGAIGIQLRKLRRQQFHKQQKVK